MRAEEGMPGHVGAVAAGLRLAPNSLGERADVMRACPATDAKVADVLGERVPISSLKSYMGHTLGACGALESWLAIEMMNNGWFAPTINLENVDPECAELDYVVGDGRENDVEYVMNNNFAFGGINTSLIFRRHDS